ncbi:MAG: extracellular solute-binding protein [Spirochaetales bacterium]|nr:extracellular solute-binding protein [Spirochaetales bacterium]
MKIMKKLVIVWSLLALVSGAVFAAGEAESASSEEIVTLEIFPMSANTAGLMEGWWAEILEKDIGVRLEVIPAGDQSLQKLQALMAGGELPDVVTFQTVKQVDDAVRANLLLNLDDYIDKLPNVQKNASVALQFYRNTASAGTGNAYAIPNNVGPGGVGDELNPALYMRWDLYKKLGMPEIKVLEDILPLLKKMQELEPVNADGQKVYGFSIWGDWDQYIMYMATHFAGYLGMDANAQLASDVPFLQVDINSGKTMSMLDEGSEYMRAIRLYFNANQMGLVDPDSLTQTFGSARGKAKEGRTLFSWFSWFHGGYNTPDRTDIDDFKGFRPISLNGYKALLAGDNNIGKTWAFAISSSTEKIDAALRYVDYMYSYDGLWQLTNGPKGVIWDLDEDGIPYVTENGWDIIDNGKDLPGGGKIGEGTSTINSVGLSLASIYPTYGVPLNSNYWASSKGREPTKLMQDWQETTGYKTTTDLLIDKGMYTPRPLWMGVVPPMSDEIQILVSQIGEIIKTDSWLLVFAKDEEEFQQIYRNMVKKAKGLGLDKVLEWDMKVLNEAKEIAEQYK